MAAWATNVPTSTSAENLCLIELLIDLSFDPAFHVDADDVAAAATFWKASDGAYQYALPK